MPVDTFQSVSFQKMHVTKESKPKTCIYYQLKTIQSYEKSLEKTNKKGQMSS